MRQWLWTEEAGRPERRQQETNTPHLTVWSGAKLRPTYTAQQFEETSTHSNTLWQADGKAKQDGDLNFWNAGYKQQSYNKELSEMARAIKKTNFLKKIIWGEQIHKSRYTVCCFDNFVRSEL